ncbi:MAG: hypothetical protein EP336_04125 [Rhodobacteraceae bacterium]|nr:MAG: hypothetical protein EP336_04125 [Paracoccaceae bacterium]
MQNLFDNRSAYDAFRDRRGSQLVEAGARPDVSTIIPYDMVSARKCVDLRGDRSTAVAMTRAYIAHGGDPNLQVNGAKPWPEIHTQFTTGHNGLGRYIDSLEQDLPLRSTTAMEALQSVTEALGAFLVAQRKLGGESDGERQHLCVHSGGNFAVPVKTPHLRNPCRQGPCAGRTSLARRCHGRSSAAMTAPVPKVRAIPSAVSCISNRGAPRTDMSR